MTDTQRIAVVTGASRGIGAATARRLARDGYDVCVQYHTDEKLAAAVVQDVKREGRRAIAVQADLGSERDILRLFATVDQELGHLSALVNNAAVNLSSGNGTVEESEWSVIERVLAVNVLGVFACCREAVKRMKTAGAGGIVNVSSEAARFGGNRMAAYAASKAALNTFTLALAREVAPLGIRVNAVSPGVIDTEVHGNITAERRQGLMASIPMGRMGTPDEVAAAIAWLLSGDASYAAGSILPLTGAR